MAMIPTAMLPIWFSGLFSFGIIGGAIYILREWYRNSWVYDTLRDQSFFSPDIGWNAPTALLVIGLLLLIWALAGGLLIQLVLGIMTRNNQQMQPTAARDGRVERLQRPDGTELQVEHYGRETGPVLIFTHGWGTDSTEWYAVKRQLSDRFHLIVWDLPGVGKSTRPQNNDYSLEKFANDLKAIADQCAGHPVILVGHSIGGMVTLTFCRLFPEVLGPQIAGIALVHTTYINPVRTTTMAALNTALERPVIVPMLYLTTWLSPLVWMMNLTSFLNGSSQLSTKMSGFAGGESLQQINFAARYGLFMSPAVLARGMFGMLRYDATATLKTIPIPSLVVPATLDPVCKPTASERMTQDLPVATLSPLAPAKHMGFMEHNNQFATLISTFADSCFQTSPSTVNPSSDKALRS